MDLGTSIGALLVASWFATGLTGALLLQTYIYFRYKPKDDNGIFAVLVVILCCLDAAHVICIMDTLYTYVVTDFGNRIDLGRLTPALALSIAFTKMITFVVKTFFCWRVYKLCKWRRFSTPTIFVLLLAELGFGWAAATKGIILGSFKMFTSELRWVFTTAVIVGVLSDILITASLCFWLREAGKNMPTIDGTINTIIRYTIENGTITSIASVATLVCVLALPNSMLFIAIHFVISKLYINTFLASLNNRNSFRRERQNLQDVESISSIRFTIGLRIPMDSKQNSSVLQHKHSAQTEVSSHSVLGGTDNKELRMYDTMGRALR